MSDRSPTPDLLPRFQKKSRLDVAEHGTIGRNVAPEIKGATNIKRSPAGPKDPMDSNKSTGGVHLEASLGAGSGSNSTDIKGGARAPKADWAFLRKG